MITWCDSSPLETGFVPARSCYFVHWVNQGYEGLNCIQSTRNVVGSSQEEPPPRCRARLKHLTQAEVFLFYAANMCWLPIKQQQLSVKQTSLCKSAWGTLVFKPRAPKAGLWGATCMINKSQGPLCRCSKQERSRGPGPSLARALPSTMPAWTSSSAFCSGAQQLPQAPKSHQDDTLMRNIMRFLTEVRAGAAQA